MSKYFSDECNSHVETTVTFEMSEPALVSCVGYSSGGYNPYTDCSDYGYFHDYSATVRNIDEAVEVFEALDNANVLPTRAL